MAKLLKVLDVLKSINLILINFFPKIAINSKNKATTLTILIKNLNDEINQSASRFANYFALQNPINQQQSNLLSIMNYNNCF